MNCILKNKNKNVKLLLLGHTPKEVTKERIIHTITDNKTYVCKY